MIAVATLALLSSGCASYAWYRPDTPPAVAAQDAGQCSDLARDAARDIILTAGFHTPLILGPRGPWPYVGWGAWGDPYWGPAGDPLWRMDVERRLESRCMRGRGYELYRVPNA